MCRFLLLTGAAILGLASPSLAGVKTMACDRYSIGTNGLKANVFSYTVAADLDANTVAVKVTDHPKDSQAGKFPLPEGNGWKISWRSKDQLRVVGLITDFSDNVFDSPVMMLDLDFGNARMRYEEAAD